MSKWIKRILWIFLVIAVACVLYTAYYYFVWIKFSPSMIERADAALENGITIADEQNDFVIMESNKEIPNDNNPSPYSFPYFDIKDVQMGTDDNYLYCKVIFQDILPIKPGNINGNIFIAVGINISLMDSGGHEQIVLHMGTGWAPVLHFPASDSFYSWGPTGIEWPETARFLHEERDSKVSGGIGTNYLLVALPLEKMNLNQGDTIYFSVSQETKSMKYTHAAVDVLLGEGKMPAFIEWIIGSNSYRIIDMY